MANTHSSSDKHSGSTDHQKASSEGKKGVTQDQVGSGKEHDPNNFANNPERASAAGKKGGQHSHDRD